MRQLSPVKQLAAIRKKLGHFSTEAQPKDYLDTGDEELNIVLGCLGKGIPYGKLLELSGGEQTGKTALALDLLAGAQKENAMGIWVDAENSFDVDWAAKREVDVSKLIVISPYVGKFKKEKKERLITAQEMLEEAELAVVSNYATMGVRSAKMFMVVDSVTALLTREEAEAGINSQNMRTKLSLSAFLSQLLRRWVGTAQSYNTTMLFINQIRNNPAQMFGNPEYTPGGKALKFYCHVRAGMRRVKGGRVMRAGKQIGIKGVLRNTKNKVGGLEYSESGYHISFDGSTEAIPMSQIKKDDV